MLAANFKWCCIQCFKCSISKCFPSALCSTLQQTLLFQSAYFFQFIFIFTTSFRLNSFSPAWPKIPISPFFVSIISTVKFWQHCHSPPVAPPVVTQAELQPKTALLQHHNYFSMELPNTLVHCKGVPNPSPGPHGAKKPEAAINIRPRSWIPPLLATFARMQEMTTFISAWGFAPKSSFIKRPFLKHLLHFFSWTYCETAAF